MANQPPEKTFRIGLISASIFKQTVDAKEAGQKKRVFRTVSFQRAYRDGDEWKNATSFTLADLPILEAVREMAFDYMAGIEADATT